MPRLSSVLAQVSVSRLSEMVPCSKQELSPERELECSPDLFLQVLPRRDRLAWARVSDLTTVSPCHKHIFMPKQRYQPSHAFIVVYNLNQSRNNIEEQSSHQLNKRVLASLTWNKLVQYSDTNHGTQQHQEETQDQKTMEQTLRLVSLRKLQLRQLGITLRKEEYELGQLTLNKTSFEQTCPRRESKPQQSDGCSSQNNKVKF